jgi:hypothetical protein
MFIVWDEPKRLANLAKHGLDFDTFEEAFDFRTAFTVPAGQSRTGRQREMLIGLMAGRVVVAIISPLGTEALSLISLRYADPAQRKLFHGT